LISDDSRRYMERPIGAFDEFGAREARERGQNWSIEKVKDGELAGFKVTEYYYKPNRPVHANFVLDCWCTGELKISRSLCDACWAFVGCDSMKGHGMPLRITALNKSGRKFVYLDTKSIKQTTPLVFTPPTGYKKVQTAIELVSGDDIAGDTNIPTIMKGDKHGGKGSSDGKGTKAGPSAAAAKDDLIRKAGADLKSTYNGRDPLGFNPDSWDTSLNDKPASTGSNAGSNVKSTTGGSHGNARSASSQRQSGNSGTQR
jgi:hypothetical protein